MTIGVPQQSGKRTGYARQEYDWYVEPISATSRLLRVERPFVGSVLDPCCGQGNVVSAVRDGCEEGSNGPCVVFGTDIVRRNPEFQVRDFRESIREGGKGWNKWSSIITNPPFSLAQEIIELSVEHVRDRVCMFLRSAFLEGISRQDFFRRHPPARVWHFPDRVQCLPGTMTEDQKPKGGGVTAYSWFVWERGHTGPYRGSWLDAESRKAKKTP